VTVQPVVADEPAAVALVHVHVVHAVARPEAEDLVRHGSLGTPPLPEDVGHDGGVAGGPAHVMVEQVGEIVVRTGGVRGERPHRRRVEQVAADEVEVRRTRARRQRT